MEIILSQTLFREVTKFLQQGQDGWVQTQPADNEDTVEMTS